MERRGRDFEEDADQHHGQRDNYQCLVLGQRSQMRNLVNLRGSGGAEDQRDSVQQEGCRKRSEQEVLDRGFGTAARVLAIAGQNVGGDGGDFERNEYNQQFDGAGKQAHADCAEDDQRIELTLMMTVRGHSVE